MTQKTPLEWKNFFETEQFETEYVYEGNDLGYTLGEENTVFKVWAPTAEKVVLNLYLNGDNRVKERLEEIPMQESASGVWSVCVEKCLKNYYYTYTVIANGETHETQDVYSKACGVNGQRSMVVDLNDTNPDGWQEDSYVYEASCLPVLYELHIKDFSYSESSGIPEQYRGKYKAFTIEDSTLYGKGQKSTCMSYLKKLGITHIHLLPCFDFGSVDEASLSDAQFNWGYDPVNYNVPEGSYATDAFDGTVRIREFKEMVMALHRAGIGVVMDVVYNHTFSLDSCFQRTVPYYYYRIEEDGAFSNGSVCGNDTASERKMFRKYMIDSVCYWAKEYHIDGFRFDLMGLHDVETMNEIRQKLDELPGGKNILMYGEPWAGGETNIGSGAIQAIKKNVGLLNERIAIFNDDTRDAVKGSVFYEEEPGFVNGGAGLEKEVCSGILAWCDGEGGYQPKNPGQTITYVSSHDNWTLWDKLCYTMQAIPEFIRKDDKILQANKFAAGIIMTSLGTVFFQAGEEAGRTKRGCGDSFKSHPSLNAIDWERVYQFEDLVEYYRGMLEIRKGCYGYWCREMEAVDRIRFYQCEKGLIIYSIDAWNKKDKWKKLWVVYSSRAENCYVKLPKGERVLLSDGKSVLAKPMKLDDPQCVPTMTGGVSVFGELW